MVVVEVGGLGRGGTRGEALQDDRTGQREVVHHMDSSRDMGKGLTVLASLVCSDSHA